MHHSIIKSMTTTNRKFITTASGLALAITLALPATGYGNPQPNNQSYGNQPGQQSTREERITVSTGAEYAADSHQESRFSPMTSSDLLRLDVKSASGETVGETDDIIVDMQTGEIVAVVISTRSFFGLARNRNLLSSEDVSYNSDFWGLRSDMTRREISRAPRYSKGNVSGLAQVQSFASSTSAKRASGDTHTTASGSSNDFAHVAAVTELIGMKVENSQGQHVGSVDKVYLDLKGQKVLGLVISANGKQSILSLNDVSFNRKDLKVRVGLDQAALRALPDYTVGYWPGS